MRTAEPNGPRSRSSPTSLAEQADVDALVAGIDLGLEVASQPAFRDLIKRWVVPAKRMSREDTVTFIRRSCLSYFHPVGTCAMGSGKDSVVDAELRVHGIDGLAHRRRFDHANDCLGEYTGSRRDDRRVRGTADRGRQSGRPCH